MMTQHAMAVGVGLVVAVGASACVLDLQGFEVTDREELRFSVTDTPDIDLSTFDGPIEVRGWDQSDVRVVVEKRAGNDELLNEIDVVSEQVGNQISVAARRRDHRPRVTVSVVSSWRGASLVASVPFGSNVTAKTDDGHITVDEVNGSIVLHTDDGAIRGRSLEGSVAATSDDGSVQLQDVIGDIDAGADDGSIEVSGQVNRLRARSDDGSIRVNVGPQSTMADDWRLETDDGSVTLAVAPGFSGVVDARTDDGRVRWADVFEMAAMDSSVGDDDKNRRRFTLGDGGHVVHLRSDDGSIRIEEY